MGALQSKQAKDKRQNPSKGEVKIICISEMKWNTPAQEETFVSIIRPYACIPPPFAKL